MKCAWNEFLSILPQNMKQDVDHLGREQLQELRLRLGRPPELVLGVGCQCLEKTVTRHDLEMVVNLASRYSPWAAATVSQGYITAPGGHRIGLCGTVAERGFRDLTSLNIRVARDFPGLADGIESKRNILILGPPGCGKTTLMRDLCRKLANTNTVTVVDERGELFPEGFLPGKRMDVISGCRKVCGIDMALRTTGPQYIAVDEITAQEDCQALLQAGWCGVNLVAAAHASDKQDLLRRQIYRPLVDLQLFEDLVILRRDKSWYSERMVT